MNISVYDSNFKKVAMLGDNYISCLWSEGYNSVEPFSLEVIRDDYTVDSIKTGHFVTRQDRKQVMVIQTVQIKADTIVAQGVQATQLLDNVAMLGTIKANENIENQIAKYYAVATRIPILNFAFTTSHLAKTQISNKSFLEVCLHYCEEQDLGFAVIKSENGLIATFYERNNEKAVLSETFGTLDYAEINESIENEKNYAIVLGMDLTYDRMRIDVDETEGRPRKELVVDARDIQPDSSTEEDLYERLVSRGKQKLAEHRRSYLVQVKGNEFSKDFDLGDTIIIRSESLKINYTAKLIRFIEKSQNNENDITIEIGSLKKRGKIWQ